MTSNDTFLIFAILDLIMIICACACIPMHLILLSLIKQICSHVAIHLKYLITIACLSVSLWKATKVLSAFLPQNNNQYVSFEREVYVCARRGKTAGTPAIQTAFFFFSYARLAEWSSYLWLRFPVSTVVQANNTETPVKNIDVLCQGSLNVSANSCGKTVVKWKLN